MGLDIEGYEILEIIAANPGIYPGELQRQLLSALKKRAGRDIEFTYWKLIHRLATYEKKNYLTRTEEPNRVLLKLTDTGREVLA